MAAAHEAAPEAEAAQTTAPAIAEALPGIAPPLTGHGGTAARLLALQRAAGNQAVNRVLARRPADGPVTWSDPKLEELVNAPKDNGDLYRYMHHRDGEAARMAELHSARWAFKAEQNKLDPDNPSHKPAFDAYRAKVQRIDDQFLTDYRNTASLLNPLEEAPEGGWKKGQAPAKLTSQTHALTDAERDRVRDAMVPGTAAAAGKFVSKLPGEAETWEQKVTKALDALVDDMYKGLVEGKTEADRKDENLTPWERFHAIADVAKEETDKVFGSYNRGPAMRHGQGMHGGNLWDRWEVKGEEMKRDPKAETEAQYDQTLTAHAIELAKYHLASSKKVGRINIAHNADLERKTASEGETEAEADIAKRILTSLVSRRRQALIDIERGWRGAARGNIVMLQRWQSADPAERRKTWWYTFQMLIHEYLHTLTAGAYYTFAKTLSPLAYHTFVEGMTSLFTEIVWNNLSFRTTSGGLNTRVEGKDYVGDKETEAAIAANMPMPRYGAYEQALAIMEVVGPHNMYAAYFLGETELVRPSKEAKK